MYCLAQQNNRSNFTPNRTQTPAYDVNYNVEEVEIPNPDAHIWLSGTLTLPMKKNVRYTCVVLISDYGQHNRDETAYGHKPFWVLADYLSQHGYAVLRYDERGTEKSKGNYRSATFNDLTSDANAAIQYLQTRNDIGKIGFCGHGSGASVVMQATKNQLSDIRFLILLAGNGLDGDSLYRWQTSATANSNNDFESLKQSSVLLKTITKTILENEEWSHGIAKIKSRLWDTIKLQKPNWSDGTIVRIVEKITAEITLEKYALIRFQPSSALPQICCPILVLQGEKDVQIPVEASINSIHKLTAGNDSTTFKTFPSLNHLFQEANTGMIKEYETIDQTFSPIAMKEILDWLNKEVN